MEKSIETLGSGGKLTKLAGVRMIAKLAGSKVDEGSLARLAICRDDDHISLIQEKEVGRIQLSQNKFVTNLLLRHSSEYRLQCKFLKKNKNGKGAKGWKVAVTIEAYSGDAEKENLLDLVTAETQSGYDWLDV